MNHHGGRLDGKIAIITGAARGMGATHARAFVAAGARVVLTDLAEDEGRALAAELGDAARFVRHDVSRAESWEEVVAATRAAFGPANVLLNNAAIYFIGAVDAASPEQVRKLLDINVFGSWLGISRVAPMMREAGGGSIINLSSLAGMLGFPHHAIYGMSKWAIRGLTRSAANDLGPDGIRVNAILPGAIAETGMAGTEPLDPGQLAAIPLRRRGGKEEVSALAVFLASDESAYITGADHVIDGGRGVW
ncbi:MAG: 3-alpha-(or 20-beta)-hydroxysteroid dehydrogenase [Pseudomonadales bacterium]|nr:3-alpha-(or 20-beta)-hydroxysteroid dehydrogenase [Pseudomonadales bacterium]